ncbi:phage tail protein [Calothrix sp. NIES-4071]|nr:phage tail protein [Calothrix sp. NIES-4071]BAZ54913.1 phage tail protein [Calothrix sp. NIES-4105]
MAGQYRDPFRGFNFRVEIDGISEAGFQECTGLDATTDPVEYREGTFPNHVRHLTGLNKYSPISLKRGITDSDKLWKWRQTVIDGKTERKNVSIILMDEKQEEKVRWNLREAWPSKWTGPSFNATSNEVAVETLEIVYDEMVK